MIAPPSSFTQSWHPWTDLGACEELPPRSSSSAEPSSSSSSEESSSSSAEESSSSSEASSSSSAEGGLCDGVPEFENNVDYGAAGYMAVWNGSLWTCENVADPSWCTIAVQGHTPQSYGWTEVGACN